MSGGRAATRRPVPVQANRDARDLLGPSLLALPISFVLWNPWGLTGRHEVRLLVGFVALAVALRAIARRPTIKVPKQWWLGAAFLTLVVLSTLVAGDWRTTVLGHADRHLGLLGWTALTVAALAGTNSGRADRDRFRIALEASGTTVAILGLAQLIGVTIAGDLGSGDRITSTFGSATYTGAALALTLPLVIDRAITESGRLRWVGTAAAVVVGAGLVLSGSRGAWVGGAIGLVLVLWRHRRRHRALVLRVSAAACVLAGIIVAASPAVRDRIASLFRPGEGTAGGRLVLWESGLGTVLDRPLLGWGPDRTRAVLPPHLPRLFEAEYWDQTVPDRAHNALIDIGIAVGVPAALLALAVLAVALSARPPAGNDDRDELDLWRIVIIAHLPHLIFNFVQLDIDLVSAVIVGFLLSCTAIDVRPPIGSRIALSTVATVGVVAGAIFGVGLVMADTVAGEGVDAEQRGDVDDAAAAYRRASSWSFGDARYDELIARFERRRNDYQAAIVAADRAASKHEHDPFFGELPALTRAEMAASDPSQAEVALDLYADLIDYWPNHGAYYTGVGVALANIGQTVPAEANFRRAVELTPLSPEPYQNLAQLLLAGDDVEGARDVLEEGVERSAAPEQLESMLESLP